MRLTKRQGSVTLMVRAERAVAEDMDFVPFVFVEAAAKVLTNPVLDPWAEDLRVKVRRGAGGNGIGRTGGAIVRKARRQARSGPPGPSPA